MATFTDIYKNQLKSKGVLNSLGSSVVARTKERMDPRNILFGGKGIFAATGQKIFGQGYKAIPSKSLEKETPSIGNVEIIDLLQKNNDRLSIIAKNTMPLRAIARDMNVMRQNTVKLVKLAGGDAATKADMFFRKQGEEEQAYENALAKEGTKPEPVSSKDKADKKGFLQSLFSPLLSIATMIAGKMSKILNPVLEMFTMIKGVFSSPLKIMLSLGNVILKGGKFLIGQMFRLLLPFLTNPVVLGLLGAAAIAWLVKYLVDKASPEQNDKTAKGLVDAGSGDTAVAREIMALTENTDENIVERRRQNLLANRSGDEKSALWWRDTDLAKKYLEKIGFDPATGLTKSEKESGFTGLDENGKPIKKVVKPTTTTQPAVVPQVPAPPSSAPTPAAVSPSAAGGQTTSPQAVPTISPSNGSSLNVTQTDYSTQTDSMKRMGNMKKVVGAVFHHTGGDSVSGAVATLKQRKLSYHYIIDKKGNIHQLLPDGAIGYHTTDSDKNGIKGVGNMNTIGIAMTASDDSAVTPEQIQAAQALNNQLAQKYGYNPKAVFGHGEVSKHKSPSEGQKAVAAIRSDGSPSLASNGPSTGQQVASGSTQLADGRNASSSQGTTVTNINNEKPGSQRTQTTQAAASPYNPDMNGLLTSVKLALG